MKNLNFYFKDCLKNGYCIGAYNFNNLETLKGICLGCQKTNSPAIVALSEGAFSYLGENFIKNTFESAKKEYKIPLFLHLDHGKSFEICKKAVDLGFDSVMIDASALPFEENVKLTKKVVSYAHKKGVFVEAELGVLSGVEDTVSAEEDRFTNPQKAKEFVEKTGCDTLAVSIGTSHGAYKYKGEQKIHFDVLKKIEAEIPNTPLVLHGASSVPQEYVATINEFGGNIKGANGTNETTLKTLATKHHIFKINTDTDIRLCYTATLRKFLKENPDVFDPRKPNGKIIEEISKLIEHKNKKVFMSENKK